MYIRYCKLKRKKQIELRKLFLGGVSAREAAKIANVNRNTATLFYRKLRIIIAENSQQQSPELSDDVEVDEMYYGQRKGSIGRNPKGKIILFGMIERKGKVIIKQVKNCKAKTLIPLIEANVSKNTTIYTDTFSSYKKIIKKNESFLLTKINKIVDKNLHFNHTERNKIYLEVCKKITSDMISRNGGERPSHPLWF